MNDGGSGVARAAAALALRLTGSLGCAVEAEALSPRQERQSWYRIDNLCAADPLDPDAERPESLDNAVALLESIPIDQVWTHMSTSSAEHDLETVQAALARFEPERLTTLPTSICGCTSGPLVAHDAAASSTSGTKNPLRLLSDLSGLKACKLRSA